MIGQSGLWVAKQHAHSIATMLRVYAAWTEGAIEADSDVIKHAMSAAQRGAAQFAAAPGRSLKLRQLGQRGAGSRFAIWHWICHWPACIAR